VIAKRIKANIHWMLNPDSYSLGTLRQVRDWVIKNQSYLAFTFAVLVPFSYVYPALRPKLQKIKRDFLLQFYQNSQKLAYDLNARNTKPYVHDVEAIIKKA
jgi:hypothetical protein